MGTEDDTYTRLVRIPGREAWIKFMEWYHSMGGVSYFEKFKEGQERWDEFSKYSQKLGYSDYDELFDSRFQRG